MEFTKEEKILNGILVVIITTDEGTAIYNKEKTTWSRIVFDENREVAEERFIRMSDMTNAIDTLNSYKRVTIDYMKSVWGGYVGRIVEVEGCISQGETLEELFTNLLDAKKVLELYDERKNKDN